MRGRYELQANRTVPGCFSRATILTSQLTFTLSVMLWSPSSGCRRSSCRNPLASLPTSSRRWSASFAKTTPLSWRLGMTSFAVETNPRAVEINVTDDELVVHLADGRTLIVPLAWFPSLLHGSMEERADFRVIGDGEYINWPTLDE